MSTFMETRGVMPQAVAKRIGRPKVYDEPCLPIVMGFRARSEYCEWLDDLTRHVAKSRTEILEEALSLYARAKGHPKPEPSRL